MLPHYSAIWNALNQALSLSGVGALIAGLFLITKSKGDLKLALMQINQKTLSDDRAAEQSDLKIASDQRASASIEMEKAMIRIDGERERCEKRCEKFEAELNNRNGRLAEYGTTASEMFILMAVPGAMKRLRDHRDDHRAT